MKQIYKLAQRAFEKRSEAAHGTLDKVYHMGHTDGYLDGFREAREMAASMCEHDIFGGYGYRADQNIRELGESEEETPCGAV